MNSMNETFVLVLERNSSSNIVSGQHLGVASQVVITCCYVVGVAGNAAALGLLLRREATPRNPRHALMLRLLACNDLTAVSGMLALMTLQLHEPALSRSHAFCVLRVLWRFFGLGSGCVAIAMAVDRWCALTRPFFYQKHVTTTVIRRGVFLLWLLALLFVCLPFLGFGMYFETKSNTCVRYRVADQPKDVAYAYLFLVFGSLLCLGIVWCNLTVAKALRKSAAVGGVTWQKKRKQADRSLKQTDSSHNQSDCSRNQSDRSGNQNDCSRNQSDRSDNQNDCSRNQSDKSGNQNDCSRNQSGRSDNQNDCSRNQPDASSCSDQTNSSRKQILTRHACTKEELAFARLMAVFCVVFVICWMPQMVSILIAQLGPDSVFSHGFFRVADVLMLLHFCLDPYLYVLQRLPLCRTRKLSPPPATAHTRHSQELVLSVKHLKMQQF